jgi:hypothetical protein
MAPFSTDMLVLWSVMMPSESLEKHWFKPVPWKEG